MAAEKSRILIIGGTGYIGKFIVKASARAGHPTFALIRETTAADPAKAKILEDFKAAGVTLVHGDLYDHESLVKTIKKVDVVISTVGQGQLADQNKIIVAIKEAGNIKRFFPSEFGNDVDRTKALEPAKSALGTKIQFRRAIEAENIPYTYVSSYFFAGYFLPSLAQATMHSLPTDKVFILGDGNVKGASLPVNVILSIHHAVFLKGDHTNLEIDPSFGVEASQLYPDVKYTNVEEYLNIFL